MDTMPQGSPLDEIDRLENELDLARERIRTLENGLQLAHRDYTDLWVRMAEVRKLVTAPARRAA